MPAKVIQRDDVIGYLDGENFFPKSSFGLSLIKHVVTVGGATGFIAEAKRSFDNMQRKCFLPDECLQLKKDFIKELNRNTGLGNLTLLIKENEFLQFMQELIESYYRECMIEERETEVVAADRVGKAEGKGIWVLSEDCQINENGELISPEDHEIRWISHLYKQKRGGNDPIWCDIAKPEHQCNIRLPLGSDGIRNLIAAMKNAFGGNWFSAVFVLGQAMIGMNYETCLKEKGMVPVTIAIGDKNVGKSRAAKCMLALTGRSNVFYRRITDAMQTKVLDECTLPFVLDDAGRTSEEKKKLKHLLLDTFNGGGVANCLKLCNSATTPVITMNDWVLADLNADDAVMSRAVIIPFTKVKRNAITEQNTYERALDDAMKDASRSVGELIKFGKALQNSQEYFDNNLQPFLQTCVNDDRFLSTYSISLFAAEQILQAAGYENYQTALRDHFTHVIYRYGIQQFQLKNDDDDMPANHLRFIEELVEVISDWAPVEVKTILIAKSMWRNNDEGVPAIAIRLKQCLEVLDRSGVHHSTESMIRRSIRKNDLGATNNTSQWFNKTGLTIDDENTTRRDKHHKVCVYIKRSAIKTDILRKLDEACGEGSSSFDANKRVNDNVNSMSAETMNDLTTAGDHDEIKSDDNDLANVVSSFDANKRVKDNVNFTSFETRNDLTTAGDHDEIKSDDNDLVNVLSIFDANKRVNDNVNFTSAETRNDLTTAGGHDEIKSDDNDLANVVSSFDANKRVNVNSMSAETMNDFTTAGDDDEIKSDDNDLANVVSSFDANKRVNVNSMSAETINDLTTAGDHDEIKSDDNDLANVLSIFDANKRANVNSTSAETRNDPTTAGGLDDDGIESDRIVLPTSISNSQTQTGQSNSEDTGLNDSGFIDEDVEDTVSLKWIYSMVGKSIEHVYVTNGKNKTYQGNVLKFDSTSKKVHIKYKGYKSITIDNLSDIYDDFVNGDLTLC